MKRSRGGGGCVSPHAFSRFCTEPLFDELDIEPRLTLDGSLGFSHCLIEHVPSPPIVHVSRSVLDVEPIVDERSDGPSVFAEGSIDDREHCVFRGTEGELEKRVQEMEE